MLSVEKADDCGKNGVFGQFPAPEILIDPPAEPLQRLSEFQQSFIFRAFPLGAEIGVIAILRAPSCIDAGCLEMTVRIGAKPRVRVSRGKSDCVEPLDLSDSVLRMPLITATVDWMTSLRTDMGGCER